MLDFDLDDPIAAAQKLIDRRFPIAQYEFIQQTRRDRLARFKEMGVDPLIRECQELINYGDEILAYMKLNHSKPL